MKTVHVKNDLTKPGQTCHVLDRIAEVRPQGMPSVYGPAEQSMDDERFDTRLWRREEFDTWEPLLTGGRMKRRHKGCA